MVIELNNLIERKDYTSEEDSKNLVYICANNPDFELVYALLVNYIVFESYAEYWEKGRDIIKRNSELLDELYRKPNQIALRSIKKTKERLSKSNLLSLQKKAIKKYLKKHPIEIA